jgi:hypothetical protein
MNTNICMYIDIYYTYRINLFTTEIIKISVYFNHIYLIRQGLEGHAQAAECRLLKDSEKEEGSPSKRAKN